MGVWMMNRPRDIGMMQPLGNSREAFYPRDPTLGTLLKEGDRAVDGPQVQLRTAVAENAPSRAARNSPNQLERQIGFEAPVHPSGVHVRVDIVRKDPKICFH